jgi:hypothetical protein
LELEGFEWDDRKASANLLKHRISFLEASSVFYDPFVVIEPDLDHCIEEMREKAIGLSMKDRLLLVVYVELIGRIRIISARKATLKERRKYEFQFG